MKKTDSCRNLFLLIVLKFLFRYHQKKNFRFLNNSAEKIFSKKVKNRLDYKLFLI